MKELTDTRGQQAFDSLSKLLGEALLRRQKEPGGSLGALRLEGEIDGLQQGIEAVMQLMAKATSGSKDAVAAIGELVSQPSNPELICGLTTGLAELMGALLCHSQHTESKSEQDAAEFIAAVRAALCQMLIVLHVVAERISCSLEDLAAHTSMRVTKKLASQERRPREDQDFEAMILAALQRTYAEPPASEPGE